MAQARAAGWKVKRGQLGDDGAPAVFAIKRNGECVQLRGRRDAAARGGRGTATRTLGLLGSIFSLAVREGLRADNPVWGVERFKDNRSQRFLSSEELKALAAALNAAQAEGVSKSALTVIRLLTLTGARKSEIEGLRWAEVDFARACLRLDDSKTGARIIPLGAAALQCLQELPKAKGSPYVFPGEAAATDDDAPRHYVGTPKVWLRIRAAAGLTDVRLHDLRHTFASFGAAGGLSLPIIGQLLGHRDVKTTAQYAHLADDPLRAGVERIAGAISGAMGGKSAEIKPMRKAQA
jgi:integrase